MYQLQHFHRSKHILSLLLLLLLGTNSLDSADVPLNTKQTMWIQTVISQEKQFYVLIFLHCLHAA